MTTPEATAEMDTWIERFQPALQLALDEFLANAKWPEREWFRRKLTQLRLDGLDLGPCTRTLMRPVVWLSTAPGAE
jgi:hypothetical protein